MELGGETKGRRRERHARVPVLRGVLAFSAIGFAADNREALVDGRERLSEEYNRVRHDLGEAEASRNALPMHRPASVVSEEIASHRQNRRWSATKECTNSTELESRAFCAEYFRLRAELAAAREFERLSIQIATLQTERAELRANGPEQDGDPQTSLLSRVTGQEPDTVRLALIIAVALLVEIGASLGLFLTSGHSAPKRANAPEGDGAVGSVEDFCLEALVPSKAGGLAQSALYGGYQTWCARDNRTPLKPDAFTAAFTELADAVGISRGPGGWGGIALKHDKAALDMVS